MPIVGLLRKSASGWTVGLVAVLSQVAATMPSSHAVGNWRLEASYLETYSFASPRNATIKQFNSCTDQSLPQSYVCNGRGHCADWHEGSQDGSGPVFCKCDRGWADPECRTQRQSQISAFLLSIFFGMFGADQFYLGFWRLGIVKCVTLGGAGFWWIYDLVRIGSTAVVTNGGFKVEQDVDQRAFALSVIALSMFIGFAVSTWSVGAQAKRDREREALLIKEVLPYTMSDTMKTDIMQPLNQPQAPAQAPVQASVQAPVPVPVQVLDASPDKAMAEEQGSPGFVSSTFSSVSGLETNPPPSPAVTGQADSMTSGTIVMR